MGKQQGPLAWLLAQAQTPDGFDARMPAEHMSSIDYGESRQPPGLANIKGGGHEVTDGLLPDSCGPHSRQQVVSPGYGGLSPMALT